MLTSVLSMSMNLGAAPLPAGRAVYDNSIVPVPAAQISANALTAAQTSESMDFMVSLKMRNYAELTDRIAKGEIIAPEEMAAKYYPLAGDYQNVVAWLEGQGLKITKTDPAHLGIFVSGTVAQIQQSLQVGFSRVSAQGKTYTTAISAPSLPVSIASPVLGMNGLQPQIQLQKHSIIKSAGPNPQISNTPLTFLVKCSRHTVRIL